MDGLAKPCLLSGLRLADDSRSGCFIKARIGIPAFRLTVSTASTLSWLLTSILIRLFQKQEQSRSQKLRTRDAPFYGEATSNWFRLVESSTLRKPQSQLCST